MSVNQVLDSLDLNKDQYDAINNLKNLISPYVSKTSIDKFNNIIGKHDKGIKKVVLCCKIDEPEFIVREIDRSGLVKIDPVVMVRFDNLILHPVIVYGIEELKGVISPISQGFNKRYGYVDLGMNFKEVSEKLKIGDKVQLYQKSFKLNEEKFIFSVKKEIFNLATVIEIIKKNNTKNMGINMEYIFFPYWHGIHYALNNTEADLMIILDTCTSMKNVKIGKGPVMNVGPYFSSKYTKIFEETSVIYNLPFQVKARGSGGDVYRKNIIGILNRNIPAIHLSIPIQYPYSTIHKVNSADLDNTVELTTKFLVEWFKRYGE